MTSNLSFFKAAELFTHRGKHHVIGCGGYGSVRFCETSQSKKVAVKYFAVTGNADEKQEKLKTIMNEAKVLNKLSHPNIIQVFGITEWDDYLGIVTEYMPGGNLDGFLKNKKLKEIPWSLRLRIAYQLSDAITYLHQYKENKELIHGDVKPENVLLNEDFMVKLADFGSVNLVLHPGATKTTTNLPTNKQHTLYFTAAEFLNDPEIQHSPKMDVYSYGMVLYEILMRMRIFENVQRPPDVMIRVIIERGQRPDEKPLESIKKCLTSFDKKIFEELETQMRRCWSQQPDDRPNMQSVRDSLLVLFNEISDESLKKAVEKVAETLNIKEMKVDINEATTLKLAVSNDDGVEDPAPSNLDEPGMSNVPPTTSSNANIEASHSSFMKESRMFNILPTASSNANIGASHSSFMSNQEKQQSIQQKIETIRELLENEEVKEAVAQSRQVTSIATENINCNCNVLVENAIVIATSFMEHKRVLASLSMLRWVMEIIGKIEKPETILEKMEDCRRIIRDVANVMKADNQKIDIQQKCLPLLEQLLSEMKNVESNETMYKTQLEAWCLSSIGLCYLYMDQHEKAIETCQSAIIYMKTELKDHYSMFRVVADCYFNSGFANFLLKKFENAERLLLQSIELYQASKDVDEEVKSERISKAEELLAVIQSIQQPESSRSSGTSRDMDPPIKRLKVQKNPN